MTLAKYSIDFVGPQNFIGVSVSPNDIRYQLSNLKHVQYLDLADSKLIIKKIEKEEDGSDFHKLFYQNFVNSELLKYEIRVKKYLFRAYTSKIENYSSHLEATTIFRYIKLFTLLGMGDKFLVARDTILFLMTLLGQENIHNPGLMKAVLKYVFINRLTICTLIAFKTFADCCIPTIALYENCFLSVSLSDMFHSQHFCPVLGSAFSYNRTLLDGLMKFNIKKKDFYLIFILFHDILIGLPLYDAFEPMIEHGCVILDKHRFTVRDHLLFEIIVSISMKLAHPHSANKVCDSIRLIHKSLPHPYISVSEMVSRLEYIKPTLPKSDVTSLTSTYQSLFPEIREKTYPRSLQDLCRCTIRDSFNGRCTVNLAVKMLKLPTKLMTFLKLEDDETV